MEGPEDALTRGTPTAAARPRPPICRAEPLARPHLSAQEIVMRRLNRRAAALHCRDRR
jgi:hypothetical protein